MAVFTYGNPAVDFAEAKEGSGDAAISRTAQLYKAVWKVRWFDREAAIVALLGRTTAMPAVGVEGEPGFVPAYWSRALPHAHPKAPWLFATDVLRVEGRLPRGRDADGTARYEWAFLYTTYTKLFSDVLPDTDPRVIGAGGVPDESRLARFVRKRRKNATQYLTTRLGGWHWIDDGRPVGMEIPYRLPRLRVLYTWMNIPVANLNEDYINNCYGSTNKNAFGPFGAESCLFNGADWPDYSPIPGRSGLQVDVIFDVLYFPINWDEEGGAGWNGPNGQPDPKRFNVFHEVGRVITPPIGDTPAVIRHPFPVRDWAPCFQPVNV